MKDANIDRTNTAYQCTIALEGMDFFAHHGWHPQEQTLGNRYTVDVYLTIPNLPYTANNLAHTVDYAAVYATVQQYMEQPYPLLETLAQDIANTLLARFALPTEVFVQISKHNPPLGGICARSKITIHKKRHS